MGITQYIDEFYADLPPASYLRKPSHGQLCWIPSPFLEPVTWLLKVKRATPSGHTIADFEIRQVKDSDFSTQSELPLYHLKLRANEELLVNRAKRRPGIVILPCNILFDDVHIKLKRSGKSHLQEDLILVIPIYSIQKDNKPTGFPPLMVSRIKALMYNQFFYIPRTEIDHQIIEGVARLDRLQPVYPQGPIAFKPLAKALTEEVIAILTNMLRIWLCISCDEQSIKDYQALKELVWETLPEEAKLPVF